MDRGARWATVHGVARESDTAERLATTTLLDKAEGLSSYSPEGRQTGERPAAGKLTLTVSAPRFPVRVTRNCWHVFLGPTAGELVAAGLGRAWHCAPLSRQGPRPTAQCTAQEARPKATITLGLPHHQHVYPGELGGWGAGRREQNGKTRERKRDKGTARSQKGNEGIRSRPGSGTVLHESQAVSSSGWGRERPPTPLELHRTF